MGRHNLSLVHSANVYTCHLCIVLYKKHVENKGKGGNMAPVLEGFIIMMERNNCETIGKSFLVPFI